MLFGRQYDLAEFAWAAGSTPPCFVYTSSEIPNETNNWAGGEFGGVNTMGYSNAEVDAACQAALAEQMDLASQQQDHAAVQQVLAEELPSIPLFYFVNLVISRTDVCGIIFDASVRSAFWSIEGFDIGTGCVIGQ
jgi:ABC-type transport system substrate-binding protein